MRAAGWDGPAHGPRQWAGGGGGPRAGPEGRRGKRPCCRLTGGWSADGAWGAMGAPGPQFRRRGGALPTRGGAGVHRRPRAALGTGGVAALAAPAAFTTKTRKVKGPAVPGELALPHARQMT